MLLKQLSSPSSVLLELRYNNTRSFAANMCFDITKEIDRELDTIEEILKFNKGAGLVIAKTKLNSVALVRERTIPTERPPPVGEVSANFCG